MREIWNLFGIGWLFCAAGIFFGLVKVAGRLFGWEAINKIKW